jgi:hypothetical protein
MKMSLFVACLIGTGFFALSAASRAAPVHGGFQVRNAHGGRMGAYAGGGHRVFPGREIRGVSAFRHNNRQFFRRQPRRFFAASNVIAVGFPIWYPNYYSDPDGYLENNNDSSEPNSDYQYWDSSAVQPQSELAVRPNYNGPVATVINPGRFPRPMGTGYAGSPYPLNAAVGQDKGVMPRPSEPTETPADPPLPLATPAAAPAARGGGVAKLVLVSWLNVAGKYVIYVKNTETDDVQRITSEPNNDQFRIIEVHPNTDAKLFEAVIANGGEQVTVKFNFANSSIVKTLTN